MKILAIALSFLSFSTLEVLANGDGNPVPEALGNSQAAEAAIPSATAVAVEATPTPVVEPKGNSLATEASAVATEVPEATSVPTNPVTGHPLLHLDGGP